MAFDTSSRTPLIIHDSRKLARMTSRRAAVTVENPRWRAGLQFVAAVLWVPVLAVTMLLSLAIAVVWTVVSMI